MNSYKRGRFGDRDGSEFLTLPNTLKQSPSICAERGWSLHSLIGSLRRPLKLVSRRAGSCAVTSLCRCVIPLDG
nr:hypothetical protein [uncultured bacterium]